MLRMDAWPADKQAHIADHRALHRRYNSMFSVADYGSIQAAIDAAGSAGGGQVFVPPGQHHISEPLVISAGDITLSGVGRSSHIINDGDGYALSVSGELGAAISHVAVERLRFGGDGAGIQIQYATYIMLDRLDVDDKGGRAVTIGPAFYCRIRDGRMGGILCGANVNHLVLAGNRIASRTAGLDIRGGHLIAGHVAGNAFESCHEAAIISDETTELLLGLHVAGNYFEYNNYVAPGPHIDIGGNAQGIHIAGNYFQGNDTTTHAVLVRDGHDGFMAGNDCRVHSVRDVELTTGASRWIVYQRQGSGTPNPPLDAGDQNTLVDFQVS